MDNAERALLPRRPCRTVRGMPTTGVARRVCQGMRGVCGRTGPLVRVDPWSSRALLEMLSKVSPTLPARAGLAVGVVGIEAECTMPIGSTSNPARYESGRGDCCGVVTPPARAPAGDRPCFSMDGVRLGGAPSSMFRRALMSAGLGPPSSPSALAKTPALPGTIATRVAPGVDARGRPPASSPSMSTSLSSRASPAMLRLLCACAGCAARHTTHARPRTKKPVQRAMFKHPVHWLLPR